MPEERKLATVLFADIVGSTTLAGEHDPERVRDVFRRTFDHLRGIIESHGGTVEKFIGDEVMAVFGVPSAHDDDAQRAVRTAFAIRDAIANLDFARKLSLTLRIGVDTGEVVTGGGDTDQFLVTGMTVNRAARLRAAASPGEIIVGALARDLTQGGIRYGERRTVEAKNIGALDAWPAEAITTATPEQHRGLPGFRAPLIGRDEELRLLEDAYRRLGGERQASLVTIYGPAGSGKSRLTDEFLGGLPRDRVRRGRCLPYGEGITFYAIQVILREDVGVELTDGGDDARRKLHAAVVEAFADGEDADAVERRLAVIIGLAQAEELLAEVPQEQMAEELRWGVRRYFERRAADSRLVVVLEDVHWAEPGLLDLVEDVAEWARAPLLILCLARPDLRDMRPAWGSRAANATTVTLSPLEPDETRSLIAALLDIDDLPEQLRSDVVTRAEGNPLYVEEFLRMLMETGRIELRDGRWVGAAGLMTLDVPPTLQGLITARLDRVSPEVKALLQRGSLAGRLFSIGALAALGDGEPPTLELLRDAVRRDLLIEADERALGSGRVYRFKHVLIRDVAYSTVPKAERSRLHDRYGRWLEEKLGDRKEELAGVVAYHAEQAFRYAWELDRPDADDLGRRALERLLAAAKRARRWDDERAALNLYERAAVVADECDPDARGRAEARAFAALCRSWTAPRTLETDAALESALTLADAAGPSEALFLLLDQLGWLAWSDGHETAERLWDRSHAAASQTGDRELLAVAMVARALQSPFRQPTRALARERELLLEARAYMTATGTTRALGRCLGLLSTNAHRDGDYAAALGYLGESAGLPSEQSKLMQAIRAGTLADHAFLIGDLEEAIRLGQEALDAAKEAGSRDWIVMSVWGLAEALLEAGELQRADALLQEGVALVEQEGFRGFRPEVHGRSARVRLRLGDRAAARGHADAASRAVLPTDITAVQVTGIANAEVAGAEGDVAVAGRIFGETIRLVGAAGYRDKLAQTQVAYGGFLIGRERWEEARAVLREARDFYADPLAHRRREAIEALLQRCDAQVGSRSGQP